MNGVERYGQWAVVAGASSGLGKAIAEEAAGRGFDVVLIARREDVLAGTVAEIAERHGVEARALVTNLAAPEAAEVIAAATADLDVGVLVYNAAAEPVGPFLGLAPRRHLAAITVNCVTPTQLVHHFGARMVAARRGSITLVTTIGAFFGSPLVASYGASKAYMLNLAEGLWDEWAADGVDVQAYVVGATATPNYFRGPEATGLDSTIEIEVDSPYDTMINRGKHPMLPSEVAVNLFDTMGHGPSTFSNPIDERLVQRFHALPRRDAVRMQGGLIRSMLEMQVPQ